MAGNNSCGSRSLRYGTMRDNVEAVEAILADGTAMRFGPLDPALEGANRPSAERDLVAGLLAGKVFCTGHLGDLDEVMCLAALASAEMALLGASAAIEACSGVAAAQARYREATAQQVRLAAE
ncbi:FAD binding domain-containing protein [Tistlia consotensis]|uniref:FAD binding domain-containing protein n=1 Tax=Tistlia consotensis USBA 355 TaxID=560819 RepID=A0A1Y6BIL8_9PROT|nr:FAD binding domain-containing protein [Tistlia consotensis USBA 355]SNR51964.1 FAD binding domain-containing protein [Tistlia consotensis]